MLNDTNSRGAHWAVILDGDPADLNDWRWTFQPPFDPCIETDDNQRPVLRSSEFAPLTTGVEVRERALFMLEALSGAMKAETGAGRVKLAGLDEVQPNGTKNHYPFATDLVGGRPHFGRPELGGGQPDIPKPSLAQLCYSLGTTDRVVSDMLRHHGQEANFYELYKTFESVRRLCGGAAALKAKTWAPASSEISRFTRTADYYHRHAFDPSKPLPKNPMALADAARMIHSMVRALLQELTSKAR